MLGIDTGGTFTDAVLLDTRHGVRAAAKALTTRDNLLNGISEAVRAVLAKLPQINCAVSDVRLVSLSTTLATNAIVSGHGSPACLVLIGQPPQTLDRASLGLALGGDPVVFVGGGHDAGGEEQAPLDLEALERAMDQYAPSVAAFAVAGYFAVRNPQHEQRARDCIAARCALPVSCSHELSTRLDAPRRALTALLNARLIPLLKEFIDAAAGMLEQTGINAPLMVVQGDGSLISAETALHRPVETILSGPAASILGARHLAGCKDAVVSDIGGTTTDIALLEDGKPLLAHDGATVGGWQTLVEAVAVHTLGLGGDSEVRGDADGFHLGPQRAMPLSLLAHQYPRTLESLRRQLREPVREHMGRFALRLRRLDVQLQGLSRSERRVWEALADGPVELGALFENSSCEGALKRLRKRELVIVAALTPTDAAHITGLHQDWEREAAVAGATLLARQTIGAPLDPQLFAERIIESLVRVSAHAISTAAINHEHPGAVRGDWRAADYLHRRAFEDSSASALIEHTLRLKAPLVGIGAAAAAYYGDVAKRLHTQSEVPPHAEVCNAVGAVASGIVQRVGALISLLGSERYRVHIKNGIKDFTDLEEAAADAIARCRELAAQQARAAGASEVQVEHRRHDVIVEGFGGHKVFISSAISATASGPPLRARSDSQHDRSRSAA